MPQCHKVYAFPIAGMLLGPDLTLRSMLASFRHCGLGNDWNCHVTRVLYPAALMVPNLRMCCDHVPVEKQRRK